MLNIKQLNFLNILNNIDLYIKPGNITGIIGPNGAGKSTLLKCISRLNELYTGNILYKDKDIKKMSIKEIARNICYISQNSRIDYDISVRDFLFFSRYSHGDNVKECEDIINKSLKKTGMLSFLDKNCRNLSGGELQKIMLAGALVQDSDLLLLDEPTSALDPGAEVLFFDVLTDIIRNENKSVIIVTHNIMYSLQFCSEIIALKNGSVILYDTNEIFSDKNILKKIFDVEFYIEKKQDKIICFPQKIN